MNKYLPSKKFLKFFGLILLGVAVVWLVSFFFSRKAVYEKKNKTAELSAGVDESVYTLDTDEDGVYDWEEGLWGTSSTNADTNGDGVYDGEEIEAKRKQIQKDNNVTVDSPDEDEGLSQTELFARQFIATASLVDQAGGLTPEALEGFSEALKNSIDSSTIDDPFTLLDISLGAISFEDYKKSLEKAFGDYMKKNIQELEVVYRFSQGVNGSPAELKNLIGVYTELSNNLIKTQAPHNAAGPHLGLVNNTAKITIALINIQKLEEDPLLSMLGLRQYKEYSAALERNINFLAENFN